METPKLFMLLLGCKPQGRFTEQHDIFFGIASSLNALKQEILDSWPEANGKMHIDGWREVTSVGEFSVSIEKRTEEEQSVSHRIYFLNLGGYKPNEFEEYHYKMLVAAENKGQAIQKAKDTAFYKHTGLSGANSHIDDQYGVDVDDIYEIEEILPPGIKQQYCIKLTEMHNLSPDQFHLGYLKMSRL